MKGRDLLKQLKQLAVEKGVAMLVSEGGRHTRVELGEAVTYVSRHNEINEKAARAILKQAKGEQR